MKHSHKHCKLETSNNTSGSWVKNCPTKRALDGWDCRAPMRSGWAMLAGGSLAQSAHIPSSFLRLSIFLVGRIRRPHPSLGIPLAPLGDDVANSWADKK